MKTTLTFLTALFFGITITNAQCSREDALEAIDDPVDYPVSGTAYLQFETDGTKQVVFGDDFVTVQGIELRVFLSTTQRLNQGGTELEVTTEPLQDDNGGQDMGDAITGMHVFDVPASVELGDFDYIIIQCVQADVLWGRADLGEAAGPDCAALSIDDNLAQNLSIFPNPARDNFTLKGLNNSAEIVIFDALGKQVMQQSIQENQVINTSNLKAGLYLMTIATQDEKITQKLIIQ